MVGGRGGEEQGAGRGELRQGAGGTLARWGLFLLLLLLLILLLLLSSSSTLDWTELDYVEASYFSL